PRGSCGPGWSSRSPFDAEFVGQADAVHVRPGGVNEVSQHDYVTQVAAAVADMIAEQGLPGEPERAEHSQSTVLVSRELDDHLAPAGPHRPGEGVPGPRPPHAAAPPGGGAHHP